MELNDIFVASEIAADEAKKALQCVNIKSIEVDGTKSVAEQIAGGNSNED